MVAVQKTNNMKKRSGFKMKGNPMKRNFGIGESPMRIGGLVKKALSKLGSEATKVKKEIDMADIPRTKSKSVHPSAKEKLPPVDLYRGNKKIDPKDFDPNVRYYAKPKKVKKPKKGPTPEGRHEKITGRTKYSYQDYNKDVKGRIRQ